MMGPYSGRRLSLCFHLNSSQICNPSRSDDVTTHGLEPMSPVSFPPKWTENEEVLSHLKDNFKHPTFIEHLKSSWITDLVNVFTITHDTFPLQEKMQELYVGIMKQDCLTTNF